MLYTASDGHLMSPFNNYCMSKFACTDKFVLLSYIFNFFNKLEKKNCMLNRLHLGSFITYWASPLQKITKFVCPLQTFYPLP